MLVGLTTAAVVIFGVACWHLVRGRNQELFRHAAKLALIVGVPISAGEPRRRQPDGRRGDRLPADEDRRRPRRSGTRASRARSRSSRSAASPEDDQTPSFSIQVPHLLSILATLSWDGEVEGMTELQQAVRAAVRPRANYIPPVRTTYWSMRIMAYAGHARLPRLRARGVPYWRAEARDDALVPVARRPDDPAPVHRGALGLGAHRRSGASRGSCGAC